MKIIFLDIDGVLNSHRSLMAHNGYPWPGKHKERDWHKFDDVAIGLLRTVAEKTGAVCVLSSSWRSSMDASDVRDLADRIGVEIIDSTRNTAGSEVRGCQIQDWIDSHDGIESWAILDDSSDMLECQMDRFVKVCHYDGLSYWNHLKLIDLLGMVSE